MDSAVIASRPSTKGVHFLFSVGIGGVGAGLLKEAPH